MNCSDFNTEATVETLAAELNCLKATLALLLKAVPQADAGKVLTKLESMINEHDDSLEAEIFDKQLQQMKSAFRE